MSEVASTGERIADGLIVAAELIGNLLRMPATL